MFVPKSHRIEFLGHWLAHVKRTYLPLCEPQQRAAVAFFYGSFQDLEANSRDSEFLQFNVSVPETVSPDVHVGDHLPRPTFEPVRYPQITLSPVICIEPYFHRNLTSCTAIAGFLGVIELNKAKPSSGRLVTLK